MTVKITTKLLRDPYLALPITLPIHLSYIGVMEIVRRLVDEDVEFLREFSPYNATLFRKVAERIDEANAIHKESKCD